jgi:hypothetical protein
LEFKTLQFPFSYLKQKNINLRQKFDSMEATFKSIPKDEAMKSESLEEIKSKGTFNESVELLALRVPNQMCGTLQKKFKGYL